MKTNLLFTIAALVAALAVISPAHCASGGALDIKIILQADNGLFLSRIHRSGTNPIEAAKEVPDVYCQFLVIKNSDGTYSFQADNGLYLSRIRRGSIDPIEAAKTSIDIFSKFNVIDHGNGKISLQADNDKWVSRIRRGGKDPVEAAKSTPDVFSRFTVTRVLTAGASYNISPQNN